jgi:hypothetical protein
MDKEVKILFRDIIKPMSFSKTSKRIPYLIGDNNSLESFIKKINKNHLINLKKYYSPFHYMDDKEKSFNFGVQINNNKYRKEFNLVEFKKKLKKIEEKEKEKLKNNKKKEYKIAINDRTKHNIEIWKKNKMLSNIVKSYNPKYKIIYKRIPNIFFAYPKSKQKKKIKSFSVSNKKIKRNFEENIFEKINESKIQNLNNKSVIETLKNNFKIKNNIILNSKAKTTKNIMKKFLANEIEKTPSTKIRTYIKYKSQKNFRRNNNLLFQNNSFNKSHLFEKNYYHPDYNKMPRSERLSFFKSSKKNDYLLNQPSIGAYEPKYEYIFEKSPKISFDRSNNFDLFSYRKYILRKLWSGFNRYLNEEYELVDFPLSDSKKNII